MKSLVAIFGLATFISFAVPAQAREKLPAGCVIVLDQDFQEVMVCPK